MNLRTKCYEMHPKSRTNKRLFLFLFLSLSFTKKVTSFTLVSLNIFLLVIQAPYAAAIQMAIRLLYLKYKIITNWANLILYMC